MPKRKRVRKIAITVEELEIIIEANVKKVMPEIKTMISEVKKYLQDSDIDFSSISKSINKEAETTKKVVKKIKDEFDPDELSPELLKKINEMKPVIKGISNEYAKLTKIVKSTNAEIKKTEIPTTNKQEYSGYITAEERLKANKTNSIIENQNLNNNTGPSERTLTIWDVLKDKIKQAKIYVEQFYQKIRGSNSNNAQLDYINKKIEDIKNTIATINNGKGPMFDETEILKMKSELEKLENQKQKLENLSKLNNNTSKVLKNIKSCAVKTSKMALDFLGISKNANLSKNSISQGVKQIAKYAGALIGIRSIYNGLKSLASEWLNSNDTAAKQINANLSYLKMSLGSMLAPAIQSIVNLIYKALSAIQSLVYAFSKINIFSKLTASNYAKMASSASSANKATKQLAGIHNEINNISSNGSSSGNGTVTPDIDLSKVDTSLSDKFNSLLAHAYMFGYNIGQKINEGLKNIPWAEIQVTIYNIAFNIANFLNGLVDGVDWVLIGNTIAQGLNTALLFVYTFVTTFDWNKFGQAIGSTINGFFKNFDWATLGKYLSESFIALFDTLSSAIEEVNWGLVYESIKTSLVNMDWAGMADSLMEAIGSAIGALGTLIIQAFKDLFKGFYDKYMKEDVEQNGVDIINGFWNGIATAMADAVMWIYEHIFKPFIDGFKKAFEIHSPSKVMAELGTYIIQGLFNGISSLVGNIEQIWENLKTTTVNIFNNVKDNVSNIITTLKTNISNALTNIKTTWTNIFTNIKNTTSNIFNGIWTTIKKIINSILGGIENMANGIVKGINVIINALNGLSFDIPDWVPELGGKKFGFNISTVNTVSLPRLKTGSVLYDETIFVGGEYAGARSNPEIVAPQNILYETQLKAIKDSDIGNNQGGDMYFTIKVGDYEIGTICIDSLRRVKRQTGKDLELLTD